MTGRVVSKEVVVWWQLERIVSMLAVLPAIYTAGVYNKLSATCQSSLGSSLNVQS